jgi:hypothetical protein
MARPVARSSRAAALPRWVPPQLTQLVDAAPEGDQWLHEIKFDGYRLHARLDHGAGHLNQQGPTCWVCWHRANRSINHDRGFGRVRKVTLGWDLFREISRREAIGFGPSEYVLTQTSHPSPEFPIGPPAPRDSASMRSSRSRFDCGYYTRAPYNYSGGPSTAPLLSYFVATEALNPDYGLSGLGTNTGMSVNVGGRLRAGWGPVATV